MERKVLFKGGAHIEGMGKAGELPLSWLCSTVPQHLPPHYSATRSLRWLSGE